MSLVHLTILLQKLLNECVNFINFYSVLSLDMMMLRTFFFYLHTRLTCVIWQRCMVIPFDLQGSLLQPLRWRVTLHLCSLRMCWRFVIMHGAWDIYFLIQFCMKPYIPTLIAQNTFYWFFCDVTNLYEMILSSMFSYILFYLFLANL